MVAFLRMRLPRLALLADAAKPLALPPRAFVALVAFLRRCCAEQRVRGSGAGAGAHGDVDMLPDAPEELPTAYLGAALLWQWRSQAGAGSGICAAQLGSVTGGWDCSYASCSTSLKHRSTVESRLPAGLA